MPTCAQRRLFSEKWAEATFGLMGRTPGPCRGFLHRLCRRAGGVRQGRAEVRRQRRRVLREDARRASLRQLRDRAAADRPQQARAQADRSGALRRRGQGARRRHRDLGRAAACDRRRAVRLAAPELHPSAAAGRRELCQLSRGADQRAGPQALSAPAVRAPRRQRVRLSAVQPLRRVRQLRGVRQRLRAVGARFHLPQPRSLPRPVVEDHRRTRSATIRRRSATSPSFASWRASPSA